jgi:hypothetical protein
MSPYRAACHTEERNEGNVRCARKGDRDLRVLAIVTFERERATRKRRRRKRGETQHVLREHAHHDEVVDGFLIDLAVRHLNIHRDGNEQRLSVQCAAATFGGAERRAKTNDSSAQ